MSDLTEFRDNTVNFLKLNRLKVTFSNENGGIYSFKLEKAGDHTFNLTAGAGVRAYWCPYKSDQVNSVTLGTDADLMFTATMNGCSFGVGVPADDGTVRVAHANTTEHDQIAAIDEAYDHLPGKPGSPEFLAASARIGMRHSAMKQKLQLEQLKSLLVTGDRRMANHISLAAYNGCDNITTFGVREDGVWKFYFQGLNGTEIMGCFPFPKINP